MAYKPLPSMNALRSFETTARLGSVTRAAAELCVTPSAVSHQIRKLEEYINHPLIHFPSGIARLTEWGAVLVPGLSDGFMRIHQALNLLEDRDRIRTLTIVSRPFFASHWLSPRLDRFWEKYPDIGLRMRYMLEPFDLETGVVDASIEWHIRAPRGMESVRLMPAALTLVCSPSLTWQGGLETWLDSLGSQTLLRESLEDNWTGWLAQAGIPDFVPGNTVFLDDGSIRLQACIAGKGVDLSVVDFLGRELAEKLLVEPFPDIRLEGSYYLVLPNPSAPKALAFKDWILGEISSPLPTPRF